MDWIELSTLLGSVVLLVGLLFYVGRPLIDGGRGQRASIRFSTQQLFERKEQLLGAIVELEFDHQLGKIPEQDFQRLFAELETETLTVIGELDRLNGGGSTELERLVEAEIAALRQSPVLPRCHGCGKPWREGDRFCPQCGAALTGSS